MVRPFVPDGMPATIRAAAVRPVRFHGNGTPSAPFVGGWIVDRRAASFDPVAHAWLNANGFHHHSRCWCCADDVGLPS